mmetsp:Transcript_67541/g.152851  ORF Transcript_67541/g.152851 Transcript_67541/m.152851 type:complete len:212 (-) Transcript_67541:701-1336(-)
MVAPRFGFPRSPHATTSANGPPSHAPPPPCAKTAMHEGRSGQPVTNRATLPSCPPELPTWFRSTLARCGTRPFTGPASSSSTCPPRRTEPAGEATPGRRTPCTAKPDPKPKRSGSEVTLLEQTKDPSPFESSRASVTPIRRTCSPQPRVASAAAESSATDTSRRPPVEASITASTIRPCADSSGCSTNRPPRKAPTGPPSSLACSLAPASG